MRLSDFDYELPKELIAQHPLARREQCRLMVVHRDTAAIEHRVFSDLPEYFAKGDLLVLNDTKVMTCRLIGRRVTGGRVEVFLLPSSQELSSEEDFTCAAMISPARVKTGEKILFGARHCVVSGRNRVSFSGMGKDEVFRLGQIPLPPYIKREPLPEDTEYYQTVYACREGSVAAPTAGLHFTGELLEQVKTAGAGTAFLTLHVGTATFKPVKCEDITQHAMGSEYFKIPQATVDALSSGTPRVCAVGTTACRCLETWAAEQTLEGNSGLFIYPGYRFRVVDRLLTNFHLPRTTLFMLACALGGTDLIRRAYSEAVAHNYRFYSYGDAMLIK
jgi:S-adenosylmethionine:tRNA ribosyltransferase-isomerase